MHTAPHPIISTNGPAMSAGFPTSPAARTTGSRAVRMFAAIGLLAVPAAGVVATTAIDPMATDTQLLLAGGFITLGFGSLVALMTAHRFGGRAPAL